MRNSKLLLGFWMTIGILWLSSCQKDKEIIPETVADGAIQGSTSGGCECVGYVKNQLSISTSTANAKDWGVIYTPANYVVVPGGSAAVPTAGDIMVLTPGFGQGINATYGHIGIIKRVTYLSMTDYDIVLRGANQGGSLTEANCSNVNDFTFQVRSYNRAYTRYLRRNPNVISYYDNRFFPTGASATSVIPSIPNFTACGGMNLYGHCSSTPYNAGILKGRVLSVTPQWIKIRLENCGATFPTFNTVFIKDANVCGTILAADYFLTGWWYREVSIPNNLVPGQWRTYYPVTVSSNGTKYYGNPIQIRG